MEESLIKKLMASLKCDSCGQQYELYNVDILGHREDLWFLRVFCSACHAQCLVAATVKKGGKPEAVVGLTEAELGESVGNVIELDDVLEMHNFLKGFDGDFSGLFNQK